MVESTVSDRAPIRDEGLLQGSANLTEERIAQAVKDVCARENGARLRAYVNTCVHCGLCGEACHTFLSHDNDPHYSPAGKVKRTLTKLLNRRHRVKPDEMIEVARIAYTECNLCRRCAMYCPVGIDIAYLISVVRRICHRLGVTPAYIQDTANSHSVTGNQMWVRDDEWIDTLFWQEEEARDEIANLRIPLEKDGAEIMYSVIGPEPKYRAQLIYQAAVILTAAGADWTMPALPGWDNSDMAMYTGDNEIMGRIKRMHFEMAQRLHVQRIVMGECGHAFRSVYDVGNRWLGWKMPPIPVVHAVDYYDEIISQGKITIGKKFAKTVTLHDPCNISRGRGLHEKARNVIRATCENFVEMTPNRELNYCCGAGGGVINCGPPHKRTRIEGNRVKAEQLSAAKDRGAEVVIAPCHNCHGGLEDIIHHYGLGMELKFLGDIIYETMEKPEPGDD